MTWEEFQKKGPEIEEFLHRVQTNIDCPVCGKKIFRRTDIVLTSYPEQYHYECECGWSGFGYK